MATITGKFAPLFTISPADSTEHTEFDNLASAKTQEIRELFANTIFNSPKFTSTSTELILYSPRKDPLSFRKPKERVNKLLRLNQLCKKAPILLQEDFSRYPSVMLNGNEITEIFMSEAGFTSSTDKKPILATYGCGPCVALAGYDSTNKAAFLTHFTTLDEVTNSGPLILQTIRELAKEKIQAPIQLHLRGGSEFSSEKLIDSIKKWVNSSKDLPMQIASEKTLSNEPESLSIDSRTGEVSEYDPKANPQHKKTSLADIVAVWKNCLNPTIKVVYRPSIS